MTLELLVSIVAAVATTDHRPQLAIGVLKTALETAWTLPDPREPVAEIFRTATGIDSAWAVARVGAASERIEKLALPPKRRGIQLPLAALAAPHDTKLRDAILRRAVAESKRALADADVWKPEKVPPGGVPFGKPENEAATYRELMTFQTRGWEAVLRYAGDKPGTVAAVAKLLAEARDKGTGSCLNIPMSYFVEHDISDLDAELFIACLPHVIPRKQAADYCGSRALRRWQDGKRDAFTMMMANHAWENGGGEGRVAEVFAKLDPARVAKLALAMPYDPSAIDTRRSRLIEAAFEPWAQRDPVAALEAAEKHPDGVTKRELLTKVARVWAALRPDEIERALKNQDTEIRRTWARDAAAAELARRNRGETAPPRWQRYVQLPRSATVDTIRQADAMTDPAKRDELLHTHAENTSRYGLPVDAIELLNRIKNPHASVNAACWVARGFMFPDDEK